MELTKEEDLLLGKIIGLLNGIDEYEVTEELKVSINSCLMALKTKKNLKLYIELLVNLKAQYLSNCLTCFSKCGRTNDYSLNAISNEDMKEKRIKKYYEFITCYDEEVSFEEVARTIASLGW